MKVVTVNTGSSSVRLAVSVGKLHGQLSKLAHHRYELDKTEARTLLQDFVRNHGIADIAAVAHRVVHGGAKLTASCRLDDAVEREIERLVPLAPLHNPVALHWIRASREMFGPEVEQIAVFDTAYYSELPAVARTYAIPWELSEKHALQRYGFHGLAHQAMWRRWCGLHPELNRGGRVISLQLGAGCSITAGDHGVPRDTSMGFSPLEGLVMATRSGDVDPGLLTYLQRAEGWAPEDIERLLNRQSGLFGVSGVSADMRLLLDSDDPRARLAVDLYCYRVRKYVGAYLAVLGGAEAILFGGGVGEHAPSVRARILSGMEWAGIRLDETRNAAAVGKEARIHGNDSPIEVWVIPVDEALVLAQEALAVVQTG